MQKTPSGIISLLHLTDLHIAPQEIFENDKLSNITKKYWSLFLKHYRIDFSHWCKENLFRIVTALSSPSAPKLNHIIITGDCVTCGFSEEYNSVHNILIDLQKAIFHTDNSSLSPNYFSIIPGNHDVSTEKYKIRTIDLFKLFPVFLNRFNSGFIFNLINNIYDFKKGYSKFYSRFRELYPDFDFFKLEKNVYSKNICNTNINVIHLVSTTNIPLHNFGLNALGHVSKEQLLSLGNIDNKSFNILLMHHSPYPDEHISEKDQFLELLNSDEFMRSILSNNKINLILCGHRHNFKIWEHDIPIIMANASTEGSSKDTLRIPLYKIETSDVNNINFHNSNVQIYTLNILPNNHIEERPIKTLNNSMLGSVFSCFQSIETNNKGSSVLSARNHSLVIDNPRDNDYIDIPFSKPNRSFCDFHIEMEPYTNHKKEFADIDISIFNNKKEKLKDIRKDNIRISNIKIPICFSFNVNEDYYLRITFTKINTNRIKIRQLIYDGTSLF